MTRFVVSALLLASSIAAAQQPAGQPPVKVNILNVCTPSAEERSELMSVLERVPAKPSFSADFEATRGRTTLEKMPPSFWLRIRREFPANTYFTSAQFSLSADGQSVVETLVFRVRDAKEILLLSIDNEVNAPGSTPTSVVNGDTPAARIKIERFGKQSVVLARCPAGNPAETEPVFAKATRVLAQYRAALGLRTSFRTDIAWLTRMTARPAAKQ